VITGTVGYELANSASGLTDLHATARRWRPEQHGAMPATGGACCFIFASKYRASTLLVFLLVSATIEDKNIFIFKWLW
jgi:hypothetical protein